MEVLMHDDLLTLSDVCDQEAFKREWLAEQADADAFEQERAA
jgi:hypothetical protein